MDKAIVSPTLVGRAHEIELLDHALADAQHGMGQCILLAGEAGIGKSRLLAKLGQHARAQQFTTVQGHCFDQDQSFPYAPWIDALRSSFAQRSPLEIRTLLGTYASEIVKLLPELAQHPENAHPSAVLDPQAEKHRLFETLGQYLARQSQSASLLIAVEDMHWSDETSLEFFQFLARRVAGLPILLLATYRPQGLPPRLAQLIARLERDHLARLVQLGPLSRDDVAAMIHAIFEFSRPVRNDLLDTVMLMAEGNPYLTEEVLKAQVQAGALSRVGGHWQWQAPDRVLIPDSLQGIVQQRVSQLGDGARELLSLAAAIGDRFDFALLADLTGLPESELLVRIKELVGAQILVEPEPDRFAFRHTLTRQAVYSMLLGRERLIQHRRIAEAVERLYANTLESHLPDLAFHFSAANKWDKALSYAERAGEQAQGLYAPREAITQFTRALGAAAHLDYAPPLHVLQARAHAFETIGESEGARADYSRALDLARAAGDQRAEWELLLDLGFLWTAWDYGRSGEYLQRALELAATLDDPRLRARTLNRIGNWHMNQGRPFDALGSHREALEIYQRMGDPHGQAETHDLLGIVQYVLGDVVRGSGFFEKSIALFRELDDRRGWAQSLAMLPLRVGQETAVFGNLHIGELLGPAEMARQVARQIGWRLGESQALGRQAQCWLALGEYGNAFQAAKQALAIAQELDHSVFLSGAHWGLGMLYLDLGALTEAQAHLDQALGFARQSSSFVFVQNATLGLVSASCLANDVSRARTWLSSIFDDSRPMQGPMRRNWAARAQLALAEGDPEAALEISDALIESAPNIQTYGRFAIPLLSHLRGKALRQLGRLEQAEAEWRGTIPVAEQHGRLPLLWQMHRELGLVLRAQKRHRQATAEFSIASSTIQDLARQVPDEEVRRNFEMSALGTIPSNPPLTSLQSAKEEYGGLTARERQIAGLIARGKSNREIAHELVISDKTAERHVANILLKLTFNSRSQIAAWAVEKGLAK